MSHQAKKLESFSTNVRTALKKESDGNRSKFCTARGPEAGPRIIFTTHCMEQSVNPPDVAAVIYYKCVPRGPDSGLQGFGRGNREGLPNEKVCCSIYFTPSDLGSLLADILVHKKEFESDPSGLKKAIGGEYVGSDSSEQGEKRKEVLGLYYKKRIDDMLQFGNILLAGFMGKKVCYRKLFHNALCISNDAKLTVTDCGACTQCLRTSDSGGEGSSTTHLLPEFVWKVIVVTLVNFVKSFHSSSSTGGINLTTAVWKIEVGQRINDSGKPEIAALKKLTPFIGLGNAGVYTAVLWAMITSGVLTLEARAPAYDAPPTHYITVATGSGTMPDYNSCVKFLHENIYVSSIDVELLSLDDLG
jgi:hypothetical protein